jgi:eukaryotic-like serine/threonine-protein kinase
VLLTAAFFSLNLYTHHGEANAVPDFTGLSVKEAEEMADDKDMTIEVIDSVFVGEKEKGTVLAQIPPANYKVKAGRKIFLTINSNFPERVQMPNLLGISVRQATADAESYGLKIGKLRYVPDISTTVLEQRFHWKIIKEGSWIEKMSMIDLVVGRGESNEKTYVPDVVGMNKNEALEALSALSLNLGSVVYDISVKTPRDTASARIWKQSPRGSEKNEISFGSFIDIWLTTDEDILSRTDSLKRNH